MRKGRLILQSILFLMAVLISNGCSIGVKDEPMPLSQENIEKYVSAANDAAKKIDPSAGTVIDRLIKVYKEPLEKKLGYSFDKTFSFWITNQANVYPSPSSPAYAFKIVMSATAVAISENMDDALKKGLISKATYEIIKKPETQELINVLR